METPHQTSFVAADGKQFSIWYENFFFKLAHGKLIDISN